MIRIQDFDERIRPHLVRNGGTVYVQRKVDFAHAFPRFSVLDSKHDPCIQEFSPTISRVLEGLAGYPTVLFYLLVSTCQQLNC